MSTLLKMQKFHPLCSRCIGMYPLQNRWTVLRYLQCYENFSECCTHLILPETALFSPTPTFAKEPKFLADINGKASKENIRNAMQSVGLDPDSRKHVGKFSLGMRQRLGLAQAIMEDPDLLILDEPMNGLDKDGVQDMRSYLLHLKEQGKTILLASHSAEDISVLCDTVCEMDKGKLTIIS